MLLVGCLQLLVYVWAAATIASTIQPDSPGFQEQEQTAPTAASLAANGVGNSFTLGYWAAQRFLLLVELTLVTWTVGRAACMPYAWQSRPARLLTVAACAVLAASTFPMLIMACRFARNLELDGAENAFIAAFILLPLFALALLAVVCRLAMEPFYHNAFTTPLTVQQPMMPNMEPAQPVQVQVLLVPSVTSTLPPEGNTMHTNGHSLAEEGK